MEDDVAFGPENLGIEPAEIRRRVDKALEDVFVYYRCLHTDGNFLGGVTYRVDFGTIAPGESVEVLAGHYSDSARIVRIGWKGQ